MYLSRRASYVEHQEMKRATYVVVAWCTVCIYIHVFDYPAQYYVAIFFSLRGRFRGEWDRQLRLWQLLNSFKTGLFIIFMRSCHLVAFLWFSFSLKCIVTNGYRYSRLTRGVDRACAALSMFCTARFAIPLVRALRNIMKYPFGGMQK